MRSRPATDRVNGSTLMAHQDPPGRRGAQASSQAKPRPIKARTPKTAAQRVALTAAAVGGKGASVGAGGGGAGDGAAVMVGVVAVA